MGPYERLLVLLCPFLSFMLLCLYVFKIFYAFLCVFMGLNRSLCVLMDSKGSLWVLVGLYASLCVFMGPNGSI